MGLVQTILYLHTSDEFSLIASPEENVFSSGDLSKHLSIIGVVQTEPSVVILKDAQNLSLVKGACLSSIEGVGHISVVAEFRSLAEARNEVITPIRHCVSRRRVVAVIVDRVQGDIARAPLK